MASEREIHNRGDWVFRFQASEIERAARKRHEHHEERLRFWRGELEKAEAALRDATVTFKEHQVTGGHRLEAVIDPTLTKRLDECRAKVANHEAQSLEYYRWASVMERQPETAFEMLYMQDVVYFGLCEPAPQEGARG